MTRTHTQTRNLLQRLASDDRARLVGGADGWRIEAGGAARPIRISTRLVATLRASGLLQEIAAGAFAAGPTAAAWLKRQDEPALAYLAQHQAIETRPVPGDPATSSLVNADESPVATLARRSRAGGDAWIAGPALDAAERLRRDFELGQMQPRITANWSASISSGRRSDGRGAAADLTETALAARLRFDRAAAAVGPEFSGILIDVCCFLKGLETVERERRWPARSAKLVLRLGLESLARHYGLSAAATAAKSGPTRHWGTADYRPEIS